MARLLPLTSEKWIKTGLICHRQTRTMRCIMPIVLRPLPVHHIERPHNLTTLVTIVVQSLGQSSRGRHPYFWRYIPFQVQHIGYAKSSLCAKNQHDLFSRFDIILACNGQTGGWTQTHRAIANTMLAQHCMSKLKMHH